ncbi:tetratricopeptide (TPR) repeat protein [Methylobacterium sp. PvP062]|jgi:tetratricopeptide (TPR) repeat protein|uniref:Uncharacterized protein n=2 Tax=Methylobacteriaceae TaxID=119045 RepID=A0A509EK85_9HYPH|nr:hypothetical protein [Methylobacterium sp. 2A]GAN46006.1 hypothetical protein ME121_0009 [Methylobacterium sp. ME121]VUD73889.1 hypothetical protein MET9862_04511 [Methylobacterium symbioticum]
MTPESLATQRRLVPRWRSLALTLRARELGLRGTPKPAPHLSPEMVQRLERWRMFPSIVSASELVEIAIVECREGEALNAARRLIAPASTAAPLVRAQAAELLRRNGEEVPDKLVHARPTDATAWRDLTRLHPHDALAWVELALHQTVAGRDKRAERSMRVALQLSPDNRHVLRSASRLFLHMGDPERAHDIVRRSAATRGDPWLLAAEIALAELADRDPTFFKQGVRFVDDGGMFPHQITELAGAIGTADLLGGGVKRSRRMFRTSMVDPTGSSLAQGEWATRHLGVDLVPHERLDTVSEAHEAQAFHLYRRARFDDVPCACEAWSRVDPFSLRPYEFGASTAAFTEDFPKAEELSARGLQRNSDSPILLNVRAFVMASQNRLAEASKLLRQIDAKKASPAFRHLTGANNGMVAFRSGDLAKGRQLYLEAAEGFRKAHMPMPSAHARVFLAREAHLAGDPDAPKLLLEAQKAVERLGFTEVSFTLEKVETLMGIAPLSPRKPNPVPPRPEPLPTKPRVISWSTPGWTRPGS